MASPLQQGNELGPKWLISGNVFLTLAFVIKQRECVNVGMGGVVSLSLVVWFN